MPTAALAIGIPALLLQPLWSQATASKLFRVRPGDAAFRTWVQAHAGDDPDKWPQLWGRALDMGESLAPFLAKELLTEKHRHRRLVLTAALCVVRRDPGVVLMDRRIQKHQPAWLLALFGMALGPPQTGADEQRRLRFKRGLSDLEQIARAAALARYEARPGFEELFPPRFKSVGVLASAVYCRPDRRSRWIEEAIKRLADARHRDLVWRGYLLGESSHAVAEPDWRDRRRLALRYLTAASGVAETSAAAWFLAHDPDPPALSSQREEIQLLLCHSKRFRRQILSSKRVTGTPRGTLGVGPVLRRWLAMFVRWAPMPKVVDAMHAWRDSSKCRDPRVRRAICLALAWRLMSLDPATAAKTRLDTGWVVAEVAEGAWLRLARGEETVSEAGAFGDARLTRAFRLVRDGRLSRAHSAELLEAALWRDGSHPGLAGLDLHRQLVAELLIDGSRKAGTRFTEREPYTAKGLTRQNDFFEVGHEFYKFMRKAEPWALPEYRFQD